MFKRILVPVDGSRYADKAVDTAIALATESGGSLLLLHVIRRWALPKEIMDMIRAGEVNESRLEIMEDSAELIISSAKERCDKAGVPVASAEYITGDPARQIAAYASEQQVDLIILGHAGLEASEHPGILGGVASKLLNIADTSCLVAK